MKFPKDKTVAFLGDKILKTPDDSPDSNLLNVIRTELQFAIDDLCKDHKHIFLIAIEPGFSMLAAEVVLECAKKNKSIELYAVIPFPGHELCYSDVDRERYKLIYEAATDHIYISDEYSKDAAKRTAEYLISNSSEVVLCYRGTNTDMEKLAEDKAWNVYEELADYFAIKSSIKEFLQNYPNISGFRYGRQGVILEGDGRIFSVNFEQIAEITRRNDALCFFLNNDITFFVSLTSNETRISFPRLKGDC